MVSNLNQAVDHDQTEWRLFEVFFDELPRILGAEFFELGRLLLRADLIC
jgi:hypothetical protein